MTDVLVRAAISNAPNKQEAALWEKYRTTGDIVLRNEIVMLYTKLVEIIAKKMYHTFIGKAQLEDIISNGMIALIKSVESFDPTRGIKFDTYASIRIRGSVVDYVRSQDWVPRTVREKASKIEDTYKMLRDKIEREPTYEEIAEALQTSQKEIETVLCEAHTYNMISFEELITDKMESFEVEDTENQSAHALMLKKEFKEILGQAVDMISERERMVISLFYYEDLKVKDIAEVMQISASRVCQIHSMALLKIKSKIKDYVIM